MRRKGFLIFSFAAVLLLAGCGGKADNSEIEKQNTKSTSQMSAVPDKELTPTAEPITTAASKPAASHEQTLSPTPTVEPGSIESVKRPKPTLKPTQSAPAENEPAHSEPSFPGINIIAGHYVSEGSVIDGVESEEFMISIYTNEDYTYNSEGAREIGNIEYISFDKNGNIVENISNASLYQYKDGLYKSYDEDGNSFVYIYTTEDPHTLTIDRSFSRFDVYLIEEYHS